MHIGGVDAESAREVSASEAQYRPIRDECGSRRVQFFMNADLCHRVADLTVPSTLRGKDHRFVRGNANSSRVDDIANESSAVVREHSQG